MRPCIGHGFLLPHPAPRINPPPRESASEGEGIEGGVEEAGEAERFGVGEEDAGALGGGGGIAALLGDLEDGAADGLGLARHLDDGGGFAAVVEQALAVGDGRGLSAKDEEKVGDVGEGELDGDLVGPVEGGGLAVGIGAGAGGEALLVGKGGKEAAFAVGGGRTEIELEGATGALGAYLVMAFTAS